MISICHIYVFLPLITVILSFNYNHNKIPKNIIKQFYNHNNNRFKYPILFDSKLLEAIPYKNIKVGVPKEKNYGEKRVSQTPITVAFLKQKGFSIVVEKGAGFHAGFNDSQYEACGATLVDEQSVWNSDIVLKVQPPSTSEARLLGNRTLISFLHQSQDKEAIEVLARQNATAMAMNMLPSQYRGLSYDAITSQARICGSQAFIESLQQFNKGPPQFSVNTKVLIIGGGEAGLSALRDARSKGMSVTVVDNRSAAVNQKKVEAAGGRFLRSVAGGDEERELFSSCVSDSDIIISTMVRGDQSSPTFVASQMLRAMKSGSVVFDMAASLSGGNVEESRPNELVRTANGVTILGFTDLPSRAAPLSSSAYANNIADFLLSVGHNSRFDSRSVFYPTTLDPVVKAMLVVDQGQVKGDEVITIDKLAKKKSDLKILLSKIAEKQQQTEGTSMDKKLRNITTQFIDTEKAVVTPIIEEPNLEVVDKKIITEAPKPKNNSIYKSVDQTITASSPITSPNPNITANTINSIILDSSTKINSTTLNSSVTSLSSSSSSLSSSSSTSIKTDFDKVVATIPPKENDVAINSAPEIPYNSNNTLKNLAFVSFISALAFTAISSYNTPLALIDINNEISSDVQALFSETNQFKEVIKKIDISNPQLENYFPLILSVAAFSPFLFGSNATNTKMSTGNIKNVSNSKTIIEKEKPTSSVRNVYQAFDKNRIDLKINNAPRSKSSTNQDSNINTNSTNLFVRVFRSVKRTLRLPTIPKISLQRPRLSPIVTRVRSLLISLRGSLSGFFTSSDNEPSQTPQQRKINNPNVKVGQKINKLGVRTEIQSKSAFIAAATTNETFKLPFINRIRVKDNKTDDLVNTKLSKPQQQSIIIKELPKINKPSKATNESNLLSSFFGKANAENEATTIITTANLNAEKNKIIASGSSSNDNNKLSSDSDKRISKSFGAKNIILSFATFSLLSALSVTSLFNYPPMEALTDSVNSLTSKVTVTVINKPVEAPKSNEIQKAQKKPERLNLISSVIATISIFPALIGYIFSKFFEIIVKLIFG